MCCKLYSKAFLTPPPYILSGRAPKAFWVVPCVGRSDHHFTEGIYLLLSKGLAPIVLTVPRNRDSDFITFPPCHSAVFNPSHFNRSPSNWVRDRSQRLYFIVSDLKTGWSHSVIASYRINSPRSLSRSNRSFCHTNCRSILPLRSSQQPRYKKNEHQYFMTKHYIIITSYFLFTDAKVCVTLSTLFGLVPSVG